MPLPAGDDVRWESTNFAALHVLCDVMGISTNGYYAWLARGGPPSRQLEDAYAANERHGLTQRWIVSMR